MYFEIIGDITHAETFAIGASIRGIARRRKLHGRGRWRKRKGVARVRLEDGAIRLAEVHWYEATESGDDYLYPQIFFAPIELPQAVRRAVLAAV